MKRIFTLHTMAIAALTALAMLASCSSRDSHRKAVAVSLPPQASLLREITGDSIDIITLMASDANPESFEVTIKNMRGIADADLYMKVGNLAFEETLTDRISQANNSLKFTDISQGITPIYGTHSHPAGHNHSADHDHDSSTPSDLSHSSDLSSHHDHDHENLAVDPHTWTSITNLKIMAANMLDAVNDIDPANKAYYDANYQQLIHRLDSIDTAISSRLSSSSSKAFLIWHPSLSYFARDYNLNQIPLGQDNKEMTPGQMRDTHERAAKEDVKVMFIQQNFDANQAQTIADELGVTVVQINPLDADYLRQFNIIANALAQ
ncbi:MAG: zinc ABC transporter solute-binding protein [Bacteroidales bacterium]|nr:zinc ABC transporter solute-binding protein [Bacteroidales bacterium]